MRIDVHLFGIAREVVGASTWPCELTEGASVADLLARMQAQYPALGGLSSLLVAVNEEYAAPEQPLRPTDEVAVIPPVSGG